jgi:hypothetical protein
MKPIKLRWNLRHGLIATAVFAALFGVCGVSGGLAGGLVAGVLIGPIVLARRGSRLAGWAWSMALVPTATVVSLYGCWIVAWTALGHPPRSSLDDPKDIDAITGIFVATHLLFFWIPLSFLGFPVLTLVETMTGFERPGRVRAIFRGFAFRMVAWILAFLFLSWDPLHVLVWFWD